MGIIIKQMLIKIAERGIRLDMTDIMNQQTASEIFHMLKAILEEVAL